MSGKQKVSISVVKGGGSLNHDNREFFAENVDRERTKNNITYVRESLEDAYEICFGDAIREYDGKQRRSDRKIGSSKEYINKIRNSGNGEKVFYEIVVQVGNMQDCNVRSPMGDVAKEILDEYMKGFQERNPNLYVFNAVMHLDEQTPHLHIDYIPMASGYKSGLYKRNSLDRAFKEMGIEVDGAVNKKNNRTIAWEDREKDVLEEILHEYDLERAPDKNMKREHMSVEEYKTVVNMVHNEVKEIPRQIETTQVPLSKTKVIVEKEDLSKLEKRARLSMVHEKATKVLEKDMNSGINNLIEAKKEIEVYKKDAELKVICAYAQADEIIHEAKNKAKELKAAAEKEYKEAATYKELYEEKYKEQPELNTRYEALQKEYEHDEETISTLQVRLSESEAENKNLRAEIISLKESIANRIKEATAPLERKIEELSNKLKQAYSYITDIVMASGMLAYDDGVYKVNLAPVQKRLIDSIAAFGSRKARESGFDAMATQMDKSVRVSDEISSIMKPERKRSRDMSI